MILIAFGALNPELVRAVQRFRGAIYAADGAIHELEDGRHIEPEDESAYHLVDWRAGSIVACLRYRRKGAGLVRVGGWAVAPQVRGTRAAVRLVIEAVKLGAWCGDHTGHATATARHGSAEILARLGGRVVMRYYDSSYGCDMAFLEFKLSDLAAARSTRRSA
jgi:predicted GNAT family N-acyltransferase